MTAACFRLNSESASLGDADPNESLLRWLKRQRLTGTKEGCGDGDCGACTVAVAEPDAEGGVRWQAMNACLLPMGAIVGREVRTVEGLARGAVLHPVQQAMIDTAGSQCGYCTPGFVMSLFVAQANGAGAHDAIEGNLCRCTGYRPILLAAERIAACAAGPDSDAAPRQEPLSPTRLGTFHSPGSLTVALQLKRDWPQAEWIAGGTDLGVELSRGRGRDRAFIALDRIAELQELSVSATAVRIGAGVSLSRIERELHGLFPALDGMLPWFAARQVRNRATLGGNLGSASPIGDLLPILLALDATVHLRGPDGARDLPIDAFFLDYRKTARHAGELVAAVTLPRRAGRIEAAYKVAKRQTDDISIVAAAFAVEFDEWQRVAQVRLAYGGVAAIPRRARAVEDFLLGRRLDSDTVAQAEALLQSGFAPLDDHRASAEYRRALCGTLFARFVAEHCA